MSARLRQLNKLKDGPTGLRSTERSREERPLNGSSGVRGSRLIPYLFLAAWCLLILAAQVGAESSKAARGGSEEEEARPGRLRFEHLANQDGLSQNTVYAIEQDRQGFQPRHLPRLRRTALW